jgi:hypothetical protein
MNSTDYELLVREIYQQLLDQDKVPNIVVEHDVHKQGLATVHQIDVYWEFQLGSLPHKVAVQAKQWAKPVDQGELLKFKAVLDDLPGTVGVMVTTQGYQEGALDVAAAYGITICELKEEEPAPPIAMTVGSWAKLTFKGYRAAAGGKPFAMVIQVEITTPEFSDLKFYADEDWMRGNEMPTQLEFPMMASYEFELYDGEGKSLSTVRKLCTEIAREVSDAEGVSAWKTRSFDQPTFLRVPVEPSPVKVTGMSVSIALRRTIQEREARIANVAVFVLKNLKDGVVHRVAQFP